MRKLLLVLTLAVCTSNTFAYYQAQEGRWLSRDPIEEVGGENLYVILFNDTVNFIDIIGLASAYSGDLHEGAVGSLASVNAAREKLNLTIEAVKDKKHEKTCIPCFDVKISDANAGRVGANGTHTDAMNAARTAKYSFINAHGSEELFKKGMHARSFDTYSAGIFPREQRIMDEAFEKAAKRRGNACSIYGCWGPKNPDKPAGVDAVLLQMNEDLALLKCGSDPNITELVIIVFAQL